MRRRSVIWQVGGAVFAFINVAGLVWAIAMREPMHAVGHVALLAAGFVAWRLVPQSRRQELPRVQQGDERVEYLQQSVDAIALEVERIGEAQRFSDKLHARKPESPAGKG